MLATSTKGTAMTEKHVADIVPVEHPAFDEFVATIEALRAPDGCPWDKVQTHQSIASNMIEEAYEAVDAIEASDRPHMLEELGDVLLQVVLQSQIAADAGEFTIDDVCRTVNEKIVRRHPHVFGELQAGDANEVLDVWDQIKMAEKEAADAGAEEPEGLLDGVPKSFPALMQAQKISRKAASAGFEWPDVEEVWDKVNEEVAELREAYEAAPKSSN
ncbi:MAG: nucleoside triphosphate pyrophosphohydrolase, partial [Adlercreutzia sp.]|nr:nucleoside triphosphate pyrophosphohydrolase [Adlercreutzia sp.]